MLSVSVPAAYYDKSSTDAALYHVKSSSRVKRSEIESSTKLVEGDLLFWM
jgi:hypothetical protein